MKRSRSKNRIESDKLILAHIMPIKADHPFWGYRRVWAYLRYRQVVIIGKNRMYRIMKENKLLISKKSRLLAKPKPYRSKPRASSPN